MSVQAEPRVQALTLGRKIKGAGYQGPARHLVFGARPLLALSGRSDAIMTRSAFGPKADMPDERVECALLIHSGH
jgi:hypothetical protein